MTLKKLVSRTLLALVLLLIIALAALYLMARRDGLFREPVYDLERPSLGASQQRPAMLVFSKTNGFIHKEAIPAAIDLFTTLGEKNAWSITLSDNAAVHNGEDLARFDAVVWNNVSGDVLTLEQRQALKQYIENGGGFLALHGSGGDPSYAWQWYPEKLIKAQFSGHPMFPQFQQATVKVEAADTITAHLPASFSMLDEWYSFQRPPEGVKVLLSLDESSYQPQILFYDIRMGDSHPIAWKHCVGKGRVLYSGLGHLAAAYEDAGYARFLENSAAWVSGQAAGDCP